MKKSFVVWLFIIALGLGILGSLYTVFITAAPLHEYLIDIITIVIYSVLLIKLLKLHKDVVKWIHIAFTWTAIFTVYGISTLSDQGSVPTIIVTNAILWVIFILIWVYFVKHVKKLITN